MDYNFLDTEQENQSECIKPFLPTLGERRAVKAGSTIEVCLPVVEVSKKKGKITKNYRFWCVVTSCENKKLKCKIDDQVNIADHPELQYGSEINLEKKNVVAIYRKNKKCS